jgi:hypothetical protein
MPKVPSSSPRLSGQGGQEEVVRMLIDISKRLARLERRLEKHLSRSPSEQPPKPQGVERPKRLRITRRV